MSGSAAFILIGDSLSQLGVAAFLAMVFTQVGYLGHDVGHRQIFGSRQANYMVGILHANLAIGLSYGWRVDKHNRHHAHPKDEDKDPDLAGGAITFTAGHTRLPAPPGAHLPQCARELADRLRPGRPELPDRAPPLPVDAPGPTCDGRRR